MIAIQLLLWIIVAAQACAIVILVHQFAELKRDPHLKLDPAHSRIPLATPAPDFEAFDIQGNGIVKSDRWHDRGVVLLFVSPSCATCQWLLKDLASSLPSHSDLVIYCNDELGECVPHLSLLEGKATLLVKSRTDVSYLYRASTFPIAIAVDDRWDVADVRHPPTVADITAMMKRRRPSPALSAA